jgi:hypothetical protein
MQLRQQCDLEALKLRYIQGITAKKEVQVDQRLDCCDVQLTVAALDRQDPSLGIPLICLATCLATSVGLCIGIGQRGYGGPDEQLGRKWRPAFEDCWETVLWAASAGWFLAIMVLDLITVSFIAAMQFALLQRRLAARRDQRWKHVESRRAQKAEAMRAAAETSAATSSEFDHHLAVFLGGKSVHRG